MLKYLNIEDDCAEDNQNSGENDTDEIGIAPFGLSFEQQKTTMEDISGEGKVIK